MILPRMRSVLVRVVLSAAVMAGFAAGIRAGEAGPAGKKETIIVTLRAKSADALLNNICDFVDVLQPGQGKAFKDGLAAMADPTLPPEVQAQMAQGPMGGAALLRKQVAGDKPLALVLGAPDMYTGVNPPICLVASLTGDKAGVVKALSALTSDASAEAEGGVVEFTTGRRKSLFLLVKNGVAFISGQRALLDEAAAKFANGVSAEGIFADAVIEADIAGLLTRYWPKIDKQLDGAKAGLQAVLAEMAADAPERASTERLISLIDYAKKNLPGELLALGQCAVGVTVDKAGISIKARQEIKADSKIGILAAGMQAADPAMAKFMPKGGFMSVIGGASAKQAVIKECLLPLIAALRLPDKDSKELQQLVDDAIRHFVGPNVATGIQTAQGPVILASVTTAGLDQDKLPGLIERQQAAGKIWTELLKDFIPMSVTSVAQPTFTHGGVKVYPYIQTTQVGPIMGGMVGGAAQTRKNTVYYALVDNHLLIAANMVAGEGSPDSIKQLIDIAQGKAPAGGTMADDEAFKKVAAANKAAVAVGSIEMIAFAQAIAKNEPVMAMAAGFLAGIQGPVEPCTFALTKTASGLEMDILVPADPIVRIMKAVQGGGGGGPRKRPPAGRPPARKAPAPVPPAKDNEF
jgi:hypothetical protein